MSKIKVMPSDEFIANVNALNEVIIDDVMQEIIDLYKEDPILSKKIVNILNSISGKNEDNILIDCINITHIFTDNGVTSAIDYLNSYYPDSKDIHEFIDGCNGEDVVSIDLRCSKHPDKILGIYVAKYIKEEDKSIEKFFIS